MNKEINIDQLVRDTVLSLDSGRYSRSSRQFHQFFSISPQDPGLDYLSEILFHFSRLPYENISKIIKWYRYFEGFDKIRLPDEVMEDHVRHSLGGTGSG